MSKNANAGELKTAIKIYSTTTTLGANGYPSITETNIFGGTSTVNVKWVNAHGTDALQAMELQLREPATITMRYSSLVTPQCIIYRVGDSNPYEIISIDNVENRNKWLEIKVQRREASR